MYDAHDNSEKIIYIPIKSIKPNPYQPRKFIDVTSVTDLAQSIGKIGLLNPVTVRKLKAGTYELVSGERRLRAAEIAGFEKVKAIILEISDNQSAVYALANNIQHKSLNFFEQAFAFYHLIFEHGFTREELSERIGISQKEISKKLTLCKLSATIRNIITENKLSEEHAYVLLMVESEEKKLLYLKKSIELGFSPKELERYINRPCGNTAVRTKVKINDYSIVFNTLKKAVGLIKKSGIDTKTRKTEYDGYYEYTIRIAK